MTITPVSRELGGGDCAAQKRRPVDSREDIDPLERRLLETLENAITQLGLWVRAYDRSLEVSRTLADLEGKVKIEPGHVSEAIQYRTLSKKLCG
jgi:predicted ATPase with chaperone activity